MEDWLSDQPALGAELDALLARSPERVRALANRMRQQGDELRRVAQRLRRVIVDRAGLRLSGDYATVLDLRLGVRPGEADALELGYASGGGVLSTYAQELELAQQSCRLARQRGIQAHEHYGTLLRRFCQVVPVSFRGGGGMWRGLDEASAAQLSQALREPQRQWAVAVGRAAGMCERERQQACRAIVQAVERNRDAAYRCAVALQDSGRRLASDGRRTDVDEGAAGGRNRTVDRRGHNMHPARVAEGEPGFHGGHTTRPRNLADYDRQERWAGEAYEAIRQQEDAAAIARHAVNAPRLDGSRGFSQEEIQQIRRHVFFEEHPMDDYEGGIIRQRYDPSAPMAEAWLRLRRGNALREDYALLEHELAESNYYRAHPQADYREAHIAANRVSNWEKSVPAPTYEDYADFGG